MIVYLQNMLPKNSDARNCFGCGSDNADGLQIKSFVQGDECLCVFTPKKHQHAFPGVLNGGIIASVIDCHSVWTAIAKDQQIGEHDEDFEIKSMFVTGKMTVEYLKPTPMDQELLIRAVVTSHTERKSTVAARLFAGELLCVKTECVLIKIKQQ